MKQLTLRDRFAMAELPAVVTFFSSLFTAPPDVTFKVNTPNGVIDEDAVAVTAYAYADAMLRARELPEVSK